jgi:prepilin-type N-terminal cleavage/methylation domain-containing protein
MVAIGLHKAAPGMRRGFTLVELMVVVAIIGVMSGIAIFSLSVNNNGKSSAALARKVQFIMQRARIEAATDYRQRQIYCDPATRTCTYRIADVAGMGTPAFTNSIDAVDWGRYAQVWNITTTTDLTTNNGTQMTTAKTVTFYPNGTATAGTVYVCDTSNATTNHFKVFVYAGTGMARLVDQW